MVIDSKVGNGIKGITMIQLHTTIIELTPSNSKHNKIKLTQVYVSLMKKLKTYMYHCELNFREKRKLKLKS